ncbi:TPA: recombinase RecT, partial [Streptococcus suis]
MTTNQLMTQHSNFFKSEAVQHRLQEVVGKRSNQFATTMLSILRENDMLAKADSSSVMTAALKAVSLNLP